jgi:excisionase family DNA binding protein
MTPESRLLTAAELAQVLNVPTCTIWKWARAGQVPCLRLPGGRQLVRFDLGDVERVLEGGEGNRKAPA